MCSSDLVGSPVKLKSVVEQLEFYEDIFSAGALGTETKRDSIRALATKLRGALEVELLGNHSTPSREGPQNHASGDSTAIAVMTATRTAMARSGDAPKHDAGAPP